VKVFSVDWKGVLAALPAWEALSPAARDAFMEVKPLQGIAGSALGAARAELEGAGMVAATGARGTLFTATAPFRELLVVLRAMRAIPVLDLGPGEWVPPAYLREHFTVDELSRLSGRLSSVWFDTSMAGRLVSSAEWVESFLALGSPKEVAAWEKARLPRGDAPRLARAKVGDALRALVAALAGTPGGVPLSGLGSLLPGVDAATRAAALEAGLRYLLLFPALRDGRALAGLLPAVASRMGPPPPPPAPVEVVERFDAPFFLDDMMAVLVEAATAPIPVRGTDGSLYVKAQKVIAQRLQPLPQWVAEALDLWEDDAKEAEQLVLAGRIADAAATLSAVGLAGIETRGNRYELVATAAGREWLALADGERIRTLMAPLRDSPHRVPESWYSSGPDAEFFPLRIDSALRDAKLDLRTPLTEAFLAVPPGSMVRIDEFLAHHARAANPFPTTPPAGKRGGYPLIPREQREAAWARILGSFLDVRLVPLGGAVLGRTAAGDVAFGVAAPGRYLLGAVDDFEYAPPVDGDVVVQPDFEVVFLAAAPRLEPEIARFSERTGAGVGALFRITRASVLRGAEGGLAADAMIATLERIARGGVPANVARQLRDWVAGTRRVRIRPAVLVTCPDPETAARVRTLAGKSAEELTPTVLALRATPAEHKALLKRLRERGIFVAE